MDVKRNVFGTYRHSAATYWDTFCCPLKAYDWHRQAEHIAQKIANEPSPTLKTIMQDDYDNLIATNMSILSTIAANE
ncbi:MAG: hypothetical protein Harvfovirus9_29 [Harvfovirus sp.]|uniref:Uncharacterized protein n=1 Tax=Harvfovirus sp. TaxID=2487768 RepID=A0A3G5A5Y7_9VIRU|nr:MAG: hypothetical protein Harvfovirus9_29 [Harvfovirus sp.]